MPISFEELLNKVQAQYNVDRGTASSYVREWNNKGTAGLSNVYDLKEGLTKERINSFLRPIAEAGASAAYPFAVAAAPIIGMDVAHKIAAFPKQFEPNPIPGADFLGDMVGSAVPFMTAEGLIAPVVGSALAGASGLAPSLLKTLATEGGLGSAEMARAIPTLAKVGRASRVLTPTIAGAGVGALYSPDHPVQGAAFGGALGFAGGLVNRYLNMPLRGMSEHPLVKEALGALGGLTHESPEVLFTKMRTVADLNTELSSKQLPPVDVVKLAAKDLTPPDIVVPKTPPDAPPVRVEPPISEQEKAFQSIRARMRGIVQPLPKETFRQTKVRGEPLGEYYTDLEKQRRIAESAGPPVYRRPEPSTQRTLRMAQESLIKPVKQVDAEGEAAISTLNKQPEPIHPETRKAVSALVSDVTNLEKFSSDHDAYLQYLMEVHEQLRTAKGKAAKELRKLLIGGGSGAVEKGGKIVSPITIKDGRIAFLGMETNPSEMLKDEASKGFFSSLSNAGVFPRFKLPTSVLSRDPASGAWKARELIHRTNYFYKILPTIDKNWTKVKAKYDLGNPETFEEFTRAHQGLKQVSKDGQVSLVQTEEGINPKMDAAAREYRAQVVDRLHWIARGWRPRAEAILKELGMQADERTIRRMDFIQKEAAAGRGVPNVSRVEELAADRTKGMIRLSPSHDLSGGTYDDGFFSLLPLHNERAALADRISSLEKEIDLGNKHGVSNPDAIKRFREELATRKQRLEELEQSIANRKTPTSARVMPTKQFYGPLSLAKDPAAAPFMIDTNPDSVARRLSYNVINKRYFDEILHDAKETMPKMVDDGSIKRYMVDHIQMLRGVKGYIDDEWIRSLGTNLGKYSKYFDEQHIRKFGTEIMKLQVLTKLFASMRFPIANSTQTFLTVYPVVGGRIFGRALAKAITDFSSFARLGSEGAPRELAALAREGNVWAKAHFAGVLGEGGTRFLREVESFGPESILDKLIGSKANIFATAAEYTEAANRVIAHTAGEMSRMEPGWRPHPALKTFVPVKGRAVWRDASEYGRSMVDATQFILGKEGKPYAFTGGATQRLVGQFRTFSVAYTTLMKDLAVNAAHDKGLGIARGIAALGFFAGLPGFPLYRTLRSQFIKQLGWTLPDYNGFSLMGQYTGIGAKVPHLLDINITTSVEPFNLPMSAQARDIFSWLGGPTFGSLAHLVETGATEGVNSAQFAKEAVRTIAPPLVNVGEAVEEYRKGGVFTAAGNPIAQRREPMHQVSRALGLEPSAKSGYYDHREDIKSAIESGRPEMVPHFVQEAQKEGYVFSPKTLTAIKSEVTRAKKKHSWSFFGGEVFSK